MTAEILCLIPAKAASTRLKRKNVARLNGYSLLELAIRSAQRADYSMDIVVSTEDADIADEAKQHGAEVPFMRPETLARDPAGVVDVCMHALDSLAAMGRVYTTLMVLLPTSPFRDAGDINAAMERYKSDNSDKRFLMSVGGYSHPPLAALDLQPSGDMSPMFPEFLAGLGAKQGMVKMPEKLVRANGAITILDIDKFRQVGDYYSESMIGFEMSWIKSVDVDTEMDLLWAQFLIEKGLVSLDA